MKNTALLFTVIALISCSKDQLTPSSFHQESIRVTSDNIIYYNRASLNTMSFIGQNGDYFEFVYFKEGVRTAVVLNVNESLINDSTRWTYLLGSRYYFDEANNHLYYASEGTETINDVEWQGPSGTNTKQEFHKINTITGEVEWTIPQDIGYLGETNLGTNPGSHMVGIENGNLVFAHNGRWIHPDSTESELFLSILKINSETGAITEHFPLPDVAHDIQITQFIRQENGYYYATLFDASTNSTEVVVLDEALSVTGTYSFGPQIEEYTAGAALYVDNDIMVLPRTGLRDNFPFSYIDLKSGKVTVADNPIINFGVQGRVHKLDNGNYMILGQIRSADYNYQTHLSVPLCMLEYDVRTDSIVKYHEETYLNGFKFVNSEYLGGKRFRILGSSISIRESQQKAVLMEVSLN